MNKRKKSNLNCEVEFNVTINYHTVQDEVEHNSVNIHIFEKQKRWLLRPCIYITLKGRPSEIKSNPYYLFIYLF